MTDLTICQTSKVQFPARKYYPIDQIKKCLQPGVYENVNDFGIPDRALILSSATCKPHLIRLDGGIWYAVMCLPITGIVIMSIGRTAKRATIYAYESLTEDMIQNDLFWRKNLETGQLRIGKFDPTALEFCSTHKGQLLKCELIDTWNRNQPRTWQYVLPSQENPIPFRTGV